MNLNIKSGLKNEEMAHIIAEAINEKLDSGKKVLWFLSGGSVINLEVLISSKIKVPEGGSLVVTLADERYGEIYHKNSNWFQLENSGFKITGAKLIPFLLEGKSIKETSEYISLSLINELENANYKIGIFGMGSDSHTAGILPKSEAVKSKKLICAYEAPPFERITVTPKVIKLLDEAFVYAFGEYKWPVISKLEKESSFIVEPNQILKKIPLLTIFTDKKI